MHHVPVLAKDEAVEIERVTPVPVWGGGSDLLDEVKDTYSKYVVLKEEQLVTLALWTAHTYFWPYRDITPYISVTSAIKREAKTLVMEVATTMVRTPLMAMNMSSAALYRAIRDFSPTLFLDEQDASARMTDDFRRILNGGFKSSGYVIRSVAGRAVLFPTYSPKMFAGIGVMTETVRDRSIELLLRRALPSEQRGLSRFVESRVFEDMTAVRAELVTASTLHEGWVTSAEPAAVDLASSRQVDIWEPLWVIADLIGGDWPEASREAAKALEVSELEDEKVGLLADIKVVFGDQIRMASDELVGKLNGFDGAFGGDLDNAKHLATLLAPFRIRPKQMRFGSRNLRGYERSAFEDAWARYLP